MKPSKEYRRGWSDALKTLASALKKILSPKELADLKYACDPYGSFLEDLRKDEKGK